MLTLRGQRITITVTGVALVAVTAMMSDPPTVLVAAWWAAWGACLGAVTARH